MGGKHKQGNRTKNNARPSSSSHSAELLGNTIPTFLGFSSNKDGVSTVTGFPANKANYSISSDFQIIFKQMNKKDPTTRFKALQMLIDLCNNSCINSVQTILPLWPRMYCNLCTDIDHKVRETAHVAHHSIVSKVKKMIAPYLKELAGPWFISQYDTYAPAASAATLAFEEAFPSTKLNKAIIFCQEEILSYIFDNLVNQSPQTLCNPNTTSPEDMQAKYERIVVASLQGYNLYLQKLSLEQIQEVKESNRKLISNQKFWKYSKNKAPLIRSCFFHVLITLCHKAKFLLKEETSRLSSAIFNNLDESDPVVLHAVWDAALNVLVSIEDCWSYINIEKQVFAKLSSILKRGGRNVSMIYPNILPLLSKLPDDMIKDKKMFYGNLLDKMACGLQISSYNQSISEIKIIANTFVECLKYILIRNSSDVEFCGSIINIQLMSALEEKLSTEKGKKPQAVPFLTQTSCLVHYWHVNRTTSATCEKFFSDFFLSLFNLYSNQLSSEVIQNTLSDILYNQIEFLCILLNPCEFLPKTKGRVKFAEAFEAEKTEAVVHFDSYDDFAKEMLPFVKKLAVIYFKNAINNEDKSYIPALSRIVQLFDAKIIFEEMVIAVEESTCFKLFTTYFSKWLMHQDMKCGELVDLSFALLQYVSSDEKGYILEEFCNNWFSDTLHFNICKALPKYSEDDSIIKWVRSEKFKKSILNLVERYMEGNGEDRTWEDVIVMLLQATCANGEFIVSSDTSGSITNLVSIAISQDQYTVKRHVVELSQSLILNANTEQTEASSTEKLVASLFKLWCYQTEDETLVKACKTGLKIVLNNCRKGNTESQFTKRLAEVVQEVMVSDKHLFLPDQIVSNINVYIELALNTNLSDSCSSNVEIAQAIAIMKVFMENKPSWHEEGLNMVEKCCRIGYEGNEELDFRYLKLENYLGEKCDLVYPSCKWENFPRFDLNVVKKYAKWNLYVGSIINLIAKAHARNYKTSALSKGLKACELESERGEEDYSHTLTNEEDIITVKLSRDDESKLRSDLEISDSVFDDPDEINMIKPLLPNIQSFLLSVSLLDFFNNFYASTNHYRELKDLTKKLKFVAADLLKNVNTVEFEYVYDQMKIFFREKSLWWLVRSTLQEIFNKNFIDLLKPNELDILEASFEEINKIEIKNQKKNRGNYLILLGFIEKELGHRFSEKQWDQIFVYIYDFLEEFLRQSEFSDMHLLTLSTVARLFYKLINNFRENHAKPLEFQIPPDTCLAWHQIVQADVYNTFILIWRKLAQHAYNKKDIPPEWIIVLQNVSDVVIMGISLRKNNNIQDSLDLETECGHLMTSSHAVIQITAFRLCLSIIPDLVKLDTEMFGNQVTQMFQDTKDSSALFKKSSNGEWTAKNLSSYIMHNQGIVEILLSDFIVGDCCTVEPFTDSFTYTYSYLLLWCFLLDMCGEAHSPLRFQYGCWLQDEGYSNTFLESVFKLMPQMVLHGSEAKENCRKYFENYGSLDFRQPVESERIEQIACFVYRLFLQRLPNVIREWWNGVENKTSGLVDKVTRLYVSPLLISNELRNVQQDRETGFDNMEVKTYPNSREVIASYTIDEVKMDLIMTLPQNYPLGTIKIESSNVVVSTSNWRNWLFHICKYLIHQNGTIWDALVIWKNNLDKKFEGVEECYICFSILQGSTFEVPRLCCHTCKKKFHSNCLYKWFSTSNKSTCPICRNLF